MYGALSQIKRYCLHYRRLSKDSGRLLPNTVNTEVKPRKSFSNVDLMINFYCNDFISNTPNNRCLYNNFM